VFDADYFSRQLRDHVKAHPEPPRVQVTLVTGERLVVYQLGPVEPGCVGFYVYPKDGSPLLGSSREAPILGAARPCADLVVVAYEHITDVRVSTAGDEQAQPVNRTGF
jgi:hypothetical protein